MILSLGFSIHLHAMAVRRPVQKSTNSRFGIKSFILGQNCTIMFQHVPLFIFCMLNECWGFPHRGEYHEFGEVNRFSPQIFNVDMKRLSKKNADKKFRSYGNLHLRRLQTNSFNISPASWQVINTVPCLHAFISFEVQRYVNYVACL